MKCSAKIVLLLSGFFLLAPALPAEPISQLHATNYVNDFAHVLNDPTQAQLNDICHQIDTKAHAQIAVVTINSLDGADVDSYAVDLFKAWGVGSKSSDHGVLILLAVQDHRYRTEVGYGLEPILPDGKVGGFGREAVPLLRQNDYSGAASLMTGRVADVIAQDAGVEITGTSSPSRAVRDQQQDRGLSLGRIVFFIILFILVVFTPIGRALLWGLLFSSLGGGGRRGGWGGGGFGGGGGGGGFGGFGGGSSGGGGASGSW